MSDKLVSSGAPISWLKKPDLITLNHFLFEQREPVTGEEVALSEQEALVLALLLLLDDLEIALSAAACKAAAAAAALGLCELGAREALGAAAAAVNTLVFFVNDKYDIDFDRLPFLRMVSIIE